MPSPVSDYAPLGRVDSGTDAPQWGVPLTQAQKRQLKQFGDCVRRERVRAGLTQEQLAERTDLNPRTIQKIEAGSLNILLTTVTRLQTSLGSAWTGLLGPDRKRKS